MSHGVVVVTCALLGCSSSSGGTSSSIDCRSEVASGNPAAGCTCIPPGSSKIETSHPTVDHCDETSAGAGTVCCKYSDGSGECVCLGIGCIGNASSSRCDCGYGYGAPLLADDVVVSSCPQPTGGRCCVSYDPEGGCGCDTAATTCPGTGSSLSTCTATTTRAGCPTGSTRVSSCSG